MRSTLVKIIIGLVLIIVVVYMFLPKKSNKKEVVENVVHSYYYYPVANIYFDSTTREYIIFNGDSAVWTTHKTIPDSIKAVAGRRVELTNPSLPVWKENEQHRVIYAVAFYAHPNDFTDKPKKEAVSKEVVVTDTASESKPHESGFKKFFKRIFGKKDK